MLGATRQTLGAILVGRVLSASGFGARVAVSACRPAQYRNVRSKRGSFSVASSNGLAPLVNGLPQGGQHLAGGAGRVRRGSLHSGWQRHLDGGALARAATHAGAAVGLLTKAVYPAKARPRDFASGLCKMRCWAIRVRATESSAWRSRWTRALCNSTAVPCRTLATLSISGMPLGRSSMVSPARTLAASCRSENTRFEMPRATQSAPPSDSASNRAAANSSGPNATGTARTQRSQCKAVGSSSLGKR